MTERAKRRAKRKKNRTLPEIAADTRAELEATVVKYGYAPLKITGGVFQQAVDQEIRYLMNNMARALDEPLFAAKELRGLAAVLDGPDPLDELLAAAGIVDRPASLTGRTVTRLGFPLAKLPNDRAICKKCGIEIRLVHGDWVGPNARNTCDGAVLTDRAPYDVWLHHEPDDDTPGGWQRPTLLNGWTDKAADDG